MLRWLAKLLACRHAWVLPKRRDDGGIAFVCCGCQRVTWARGAEHLIGQRAEL